MRTYLSGLVHKRGDILVQVYSICCECMFKMNLQNISKNDNSCYIQFYIYDLDTNTVLVYTKSYNDGSFFTNE